MINDVTLKILLAIFGAIITLLAVYIAWKLTRMSRKSDESETMRRRESVLIFKNIDAAGTLAERAAIGVKSGHVNGELENAMKYYKEQKHALEDYLVDVNAMKRATT